MHIIPFYKEKTKISKNNNSNMKLNPLSLASLILLLVSPSIEWVGSTSTPTPLPWPEQFHALLYMNLSSSRLQMSDLWYDWPRGRNVNIFQKQLGELLYDIEWNNGTSFYYTLGAQGTCKVIEFEVGIPRPDFLDDANYLGTTVTDGFYCNVWEKVDFIWYYEDVHTRRPVRWDFYDGMWLNFVANFSTLVMECECLANYSIVYIFFLVIKVLLYLVTYE